MPTPASAPVPIRRQDMQSSAFFCAARERTEVSDVDSFCPTVDDIYNPWPIQKSGSVPAAISFLNPTYWNTGFLKAVRTGEVSYAQEHLEGRDADGFSSSCLRGKLKNLLFAFLGDVFLRPVHQIDGQIAALGLADLILLFSRFSLLPASFSYVRRSEHRNRYRPDGIRR